MTIVFSAGNSYAGFIRTDLALLQRIDNVIVVPPSRMPRVWTKTRAIPRARLAYGWFADLVNFDTGILCRAFHRPFVLCVAGYELANYSDISYGLQGRRLTRRVVRGCFRFADTLLFLHEGLREEARRLYPWATDKMRVLAPGYDASFWCPDPTVRRSIVSSVISADTPPRFHIKGGPVVFELARRLPTVDFVVVGIAPSLQAALQADAPPNLQFISRLPAEELRATFRRSKVVLQPSLREVFPNSVCEAMLCGCLPVSSPLPVMQEVIGDAGFVAPSGKADAFEPTLGQALDASESLRERARDRVQGRYPIEDRLRSLRDLVDSFGGP